MRRFAVFWAALAAAVIATAVASSAGLAATRPFPYHATLPAGTIKPTHVSQAAMDAAIKRYYGYWKTNYLRNHGGQYWVKYDSTNSTVSEAHGYGMVLAAYMGDKPILDSMFRFFKAHPSVNAAHLMAWKQTLRGGVMVDVEGGTSATDGDMDVAYALLVADVQWGSTGAIKYKTEALAILADVLAHEVNTTTWTLTPGDWASGADAEHTRPSDFMTGHFLAFAKADVANASKWNRIYAAVSKIVNYQYRNGSQRTGLMPDFMVRSGANFVPVPGEYLETEHDGDYYYNACRTPWRLTMSHLVAGKTDMLSALRKQASWIRAKTRGVPVAVRAGYYVLNDVNGDSFEDYDELAFTAPFAVVAMVGGPPAQAWLNSLWTSIAGGDYGTRVDYYGDAIRLQVMLTVAGDWWQP